MYRLSIRIQKQRYQRHKFNRKLQAPSKMRPDRHKIQKRFFCRKPLEPIVFSSPDR